MSDIAAKLTAVADNIPKVYEAGQKSEYDRFWDAYQNYGKKYNYDQAFGYGNWSDDSYNPKYPLIFESPESGAANSTAGRQAFYNATQITDIKVPIYAKNTRLARTFQLCTNLKTIPRIYVEGVTSYEYGFTGCVALENVTFEGEIAKSLSFADSPLTVASMKSVISCLKNLTGTSAAGVNTITFNDACWTKLEADSTAPDGGTWRSYVENTLGWAT